MLTNYSIPNSSAFNLSLIPDPSPAVPDSTRKVLGPFRSAMLRGLGVFLAPLLTVVILVWVWQTLKYYLLEPVATTARTVAQRQISDIRRTLPADAKPVADSPNIWATEQGEFYQLPSTEYVPNDVYQTVITNPAVEQLPRSGEEVYHHYVEQHFLNSWLAYPVILILFLGLMYVIGSLFAADMGRVMWSLFEYVVHRVPLVRAIYKPVKQIVDYMLNRDQPEFSRVVAVQYPRQGIWTLAFVTGTGITDVEKLSGEPMLTILFPTSPMPITGNTKIVRRSEVLDLDVSIDEAAQYILSYGVVINADSVEKGKLKLPAANKTVDETVAFERK